MIEIQEYWSLSVWKAVFKSATHCTGSRNTSLRVEFGNKIEEAAAFFEAIKRVGTHQTAFTWVEIFNELSESSPLISGNRVCREQDT